jgi:hypothetical protein
MTLRSRFFAMTYDRQIARAEKAGLRAYRQAVLAGANGRVLEIGGGTPAGVTAEVTATPPTIEPTRHAITTTASGLMAQRPVSARN